ncbi:FRG domain-containing protein [Ectobacillus sp. sgz5001026]|uniref:FRG domain-containing protein n=1 Tax=Ectobacillus sp. sgz5001026 TaxID=3242473 RepID=UPI0036D30339
MEVSDLSTYLEEIASILTTNEKLWYRGQSKNSEKYKLLPSSYRDNVNDNYEEDFYMKFKAKAVPFLEKEPQSFWGWLFIMQHHGVPTRLLDWSEDAFIALMFALEHRSSEDKIEYDAVVWCLNPLKLNGQFIFSSTRNNIPNIESTDITNAFGPNSMPGIPINHPVAVIGSLNNVRIIAQKGVFTLFPKPPNVKPLEETIDASKFLTKIVIKKESIDSIKNQLYHIGLNESSLYPGLDSIGETIVRENKERIASTSGRV